MTLENLTPEQKAALIEELKAEQINAQKKKEADIESYKGMQDSLVAEFLPSLLGFSKEQKAIISRTFESFNTLITLKKELYNTKESQDSHTFTARDGSGSITVGFNSIIGFDGTETAGVHKVKEFIATLSADDENREILAGLVNTFMKADRKGNLNPTRIAELCNKKSEINDPLFSDGIDTIVRAQFKTRTSMFVKGWQRTIGDDGKEVKITFSISA
jgi:hypothetical protein